MLFKILIVNFNNNNKVIILKKKILKDLFKLSLNLFYFFFFFFNIIFLNIFMVLIYFNYINSNDFGYPFIPGNFVFIFYLCNSFGNFFILS